jgi:pectin methylesterase-like acyl-CoA thioesterase
MKRCHRLLILVLVAALLAATAGCFGRAAAPAVRADITVAADGSGDYRTITRAIGRARDGDVIYVKRGTYREAVEIARNRANLTLIGAGADRTVIDAGGSYAALTLKGDGCAVSGFTLRGASSHGVYIPNGHHTVRRCLIVDNGDRGIYVSTMAGGGTGDVEHCTIADNEVSGIYYANSEQDSRLTDCILAFNGRSVVTDAENLRVRNCCLWSDDEESDAPAGRDNVRSDPGFTNRPAGNYRLAKDSPCLGTASDGGNIGCF